jgi:hypothetical protein
VTQSPIDLAFNPDQPRGRDGKWSRIAGAIERGAAAVGRSISDSDTARGTSMMLEGVGMPLNMPGRPRTYKSALRTPPPPRTAGLMRQEATHLIREHERVRPTPEKFGPEGNTWQMMAEFGPRERQAQRESGIWGPGRSYADHTAALAKLSPAQRRLYTQHVTAGKGPYEALKLAQGAKPPRTGRLAKLEARAEHWINTPPPPSKHPLIPGYANETPMTAIDLAFRFKHGWIPITGDTPAAMHGHTVVGRTASGNEVKGKYDHRIKKVLTKNAGAVNVTHIRDASEPLPAGNLSASAERYAKRTGQQFPPKNFSNVDLAKVHPSETAGGRKSALKRGLAIAPPSPGAPPGFPITDASHWEKARRAIGRVKSPARRAAVARLLRKTAPRFGKTAALHSSWAAPGGKKATAHSNTGGQVLDMARRLPVMDPADIVVARSASGQAVIRHRRGGGLIGVITHTDDGWTAEPDGGQAGTGHTHQRGALVELLGLYNRSTGTAQAAPQPLQPPPVQTPLMQQFGVPAIRLATPAAGASDGGREVSGGGSVAGLNPKGITIYRKLRRKMPADRALSFARRAQSFGGKKAS